MNIFTHNDSTNQYKLDINDCHKELQIGYFLVPILKLLICT